MSKPDTVLNIGGLVLRTPFVMASMAGYTDRAMRVLVRERGASYATTGALLDKSVLHPKVLQMREFEIAAEDHPVGAQLLGHDPQQMAAAAGRLAAHGFDAVELNFACPVRKVLARGRGGWMLAHPRHAAAVCSAVRQAVRQPLVVKLRRGWDESPESERDFWWLVEQLARGGLDALILHGRTVAQRFSGRADWAIAAAVKQRFPSLTVIGSGDIWDADTAVQRLAETQIDGIAVARGAVGNPWIFAELEALCQGHTPPDPPSLAEQRETMGRHLSMATALYGFDRAVRKLRKVWMRYAHRHPERRAVQEAFAHVRTPEEWGAVLDRYY